jgi:DNA (cytosine-5)-methyltransferase 1
MKTAVSLFSGCGGDTLGLTRAGYKVIAFSEFNNAAVESHLANFPESELIQAIPSADIKKKKDLLDILNIQDAVFAKYRDKVDIIFAGFNCQGFSKAGKKRPDDPRNQMYLQFVRATAAIRPKFIIGENVTGLLSMRSGPDDTDPLVLDLIIKAFKDIGYELTYKQQEATDFGVPQKRKRILLVGYDTAQVPKINPEEFWTKVADEGKKLPRISQADFIKPSMEGAALIPTPHIPEHFATYAQPVAQTAAPEGKPHPYVTLKIGENLLSCSKRDSPVHSEIIDKNSPSKTIICTYDHQPRLLVGLRKPDGTAYARTLLPDELKQIQGFPADYKVLGSHKEQVVQIGNAVPPPMIEAVARALPSLSQSQVPTIIRFKRKNK